MTREPVPITEVRGGSHGLAATYERVRALAASYDAAGNRMREWAALGGRTMANGDLLESSILSPLSFAAAEAAVLAATTGPDGVLVESLAWETDALLIRVTITMLEATDDLVQATFEVLDYAAGRAVGLGLVVALPGLLAAAAVVGPQAWLVWNTLPPRWQRELSDEVAGAGAELENWLSEHPELVQHLVNGSGGLIDGLWDGVTPLVPGGPFGIPSFTPDTESAAGLLAALYGDDGSFEVRSSDLSVAASGDQPRSLSEVIAHLQQVSQLSPDPDSAANGTIEIQSIRNPDGTVNHIVYLPGTDDMATTPWTQDDDVRDMATNLLLINGQDNNYVDGILQAMHDAGIGPNDPVLLAGHSQGGMAAAAIAGQGGDFNVTNVVTAGSPTAQVPGFPSDTQVLSLENRGDVVPLLDGEDNADSPQQVTVQFRSDGTGLADNHALDHYVAGAAAADASDHPSVVDGLLDLQHNGFLSPGGPGDGQVTSQVFQVVRSP